MSREVLRPLVEHEFGAWVDSVPPVDYAGSTEVVRASPSGDRTSWERYVCSF